MKKLLWKIIVPNGSSMSGFETKKEAEIALPHFKDGSKITNYLIEENKQRDLKDYL